MVESRMSAIAQKMWLHMVRLWPRFTLLPAAPFVLWALYCFVVRGEHRWELLVTSILVPFIAYASERTKRLFLVILPFGLVGLLYDGMRFVKNVGLSPTRVHICDLRAHELDWFGINSGGVRMTIHDWFQAHHWTALDLFFAIPYGTFLFIPLGYAVYLYFRDYAAAQRYMWAFLALNVAGFVTYHLYPAAPPWYFHARGCVVDLSAHASEGLALARVDKMLGFGWFSGLYGRSNDVFGAVPSLHVAYPLLIVVEGFRQHRWFGRSIALLFFVATCCAAVYLDHHWVIDIVLGALYTIICHFLVQKFFAIDARRSRLESESHRAGRLSAER
ncbi:MAG: phosphatase PAP2 family protein [Polyangiales bacterium]